MKNIHILPTDNKPSRLYFNVNDKEFQICEIEKPSTILKPNRHIYITSYKSPSINGYYLLNDNVVCKKDETYFATNWKEREIIITTDKDLIKDGVQAIDDEFLEWFVKNPSCEEVEVEGHIYKGQDETEYTIIIPKEESKPFKDMLPLTEVALAEFKKNPVPTKKETLEEVAERKFENIGDRLIFEDGAKWQQERSYSEEEVLNKLTHFAVEIQRQNKEGVFPLRIKEWFERNKKK
jgi:hypothetical protein